MSLNCIQFCETISNQLMEKFNNEYDVDKCNFENENDIDEYIEEFILFNGNHENSIYLLSEGEEYYFDETRKNWNEIIDILDENDMLCDVEPRDMKVEFIFKKVLYLICDYLKDDMYVVVKN